MSVSNSADQRLETEHNLWLSTSRPDGRPHLTPVWFVYLRGCFWVCAGADSVKTRNMVKNQSVCLALEAGNDPVVAEGAAAIHRHERPADVVKAFVAKYGWDITVEHDADIGTVVLWEIEPVKWLFASPTDAGKH